MSFRRSNFEKAFVDFNGDKSFVYFGDDQSYSFKIENENENSFEYKSINSFEKSNEEPKMMFSNYESSPSNEEVSEKEILKITQKSETLIKSTECQKFIGKKRGKKPEKENLNKKPHTKYKADNIKRTIQVHFLSYLIQLLNVIMNCLNLEYSFKNLDYDYKKNTTNKNLKEMKSKTIKEILLESPITSKFNQINKNHNIKQIELI